MPMWQSYAGLKRWVDKIKQPVTSHRFRVKRTPSARGCRGQDEQRRPRRSPSPRAGRSATETPAPIAASIDHIR